MNMMKGFLIDLDGTLYHGLKPIEGAGALIEYLQTQGLPYQFVTNNSSVSAEEVARRLRNMDIQANAEQVCTSANAAAAYIANLKPNARVFVIGESGLHEAIEQSGLKITDLNADFVVQGIDRQLTYDKIARAVRQIHSGSQYISTNPDLLLPSEGGFIPGAGSISAMLEAASGIKPTIIGKPSAILMDYSIARLGADRSQTYVIGDNIATDIAAGQSAGCGTILVLTGLTTKENYSRYAKLAGCEPQYICKDLYELRMLIAKSLQLLN